MSSIISVREYRAPYNYKSRGIHPFKNNKRLKFNHIFTFIDCNGIKYITNIHQYELSSSNNLYLIKFKRAEARGKEPFKITYNNKLPVVNRIIATNMDILRSIIIENDNDVFGFYGTWDFKDVKRKCKENVSRRYNLWRGWCSEYFSHEYFDYAGKDRFNHLYFKRKSNNFNNWDELVSDALIETHGDYTDEVSIPNSIIFPN